MTAEEYLFEKTFEIYKPYAKELAILYTEAYKALNIARKEEREKAINAFVKAIEGHKIIKYVDCIL